MSLHGRDVTHVSAREREVGFVFQHYALFRHMTIGENIEFALRVRHAKAAERRARRQELLRLVALEGMDDRLPAQLSGGQQQRIAVARALAHRPKVLLMDEPFGALDAKIREELRRTIRQIQRELGISTILVTHDQEEAFALADRIGVMHQGRLLECGKPDDLYTRPATRFVSTFLGAANLLLGYRSKDGIRFAPPANPAPADAPPVYEIVTVLRPEEVELASERKELKATFVGHALVEEVLFGGAVERLRVRMQDRGTVASAVKDAACLGRWHAHRGHADLAGKASAPGHARSARRPWRAAHPRAADAGLELQRRGCDGGRLRADRSGAAAAGAVDPHGHPRQPSGRACDR